MIINKYQKAFLLILLGSVLLRLFIVYSEYHSINSDNGIMGLMAKHILKGEFPVFFYGQPYMGSLEAFLVAFFFLIFGISTNTMCLTLIFITTLGIISAYFLGKEVKDRTLGLYCMLIASLPPIYAFWHGLAASGGYPETLLFGNILLTITLKITKTDNNRLKITHYLIMGLISGLAFWTHMVIAYYLLPIAIFLLINEKKKFLFIKAPLLTIPTFIIGSLPLWIYNIKNDFDTFKLPVTKDLAVGFVHFLNTYPSLISGFSPKWLYSILLSVYIISILFLILKPDGKPIFKSPRFLFLMVFISIIYFFTSSHLSSTRCAKYLIPMTTIIIISNAYLAWYLNKKKHFLGYILLGFVLLFNGIEVYKSFKIDKKESYADHKLFNSLMSFLNKNKLNTNYCTFWISQKLNFLSNEKIINSNYEGERYLPFSDIVEESETIAFIENDTHLELMFNMLCRDYSKKQIGPFLIYYNFRPKELFGRMIPSNRWKARSNYNNKDTEFAFDRNTDKYWGTIINKRKDMFFELDLGRDYNIYKISLFNSGHWRNFPLNITLSVSKDKKKWVKINVPRYPGPLFISGPRLYWHLEDGRIELVLPPFSCRYIKIKQDGTIPFDPWEINEIFIWEYLGNKPVKSFECLEIYNFLAEKNIENAYSDFWLSAKINQLSNGAINTLKPVNKQHPRRKGTSRLIELHDNTAFIIYNENAAEFEKTAPFDMAKKEFDNYTCYYFDKVPKVDEIFYWSGYGLLKTNRLISQPGESVPAGVFSGGIKFLRYTIKSKKGLIKINYFWQVKKIPRNIFVFVYFMKDNKIVFQNDHPLLKQFSFIEPQKPKEIFRESYVLKNIPKGTYEILLGLYLPEKNNKRLKIISPKYRKSKISLGTITI